MANLYSIPFKTILPMSDDLLPVRKKKTKKEKAAKAKSKKIKRLVDKILEPLSPASLNGPGNLPHNSGIQKPPAGE